MKIHCLALGRSAAAILIALAPTIAAGQTTSTTSSTSLESSSSSSSTSLSSSSTSASSSSSSSTNASSSSTSTASSSSTSSTSPSGQPCAIDVYFVDESAFNDLAEVTSGQLAQSAGQATEVQQFGLQMFTDHCAHIDQLDANAALANIDLPRALDVTPCDKGSPTGAFVGSRDFDLFYLRSQVTGHRRAIDLNKKEVKSGCDSNLKSLAQTTIPLLQQHLTMAKQALRRLRASGQGTGTGGSGTGGTGTGGSGTGSGGSGSGSGGSGGSGSGGSGSSGSGM